MHWILVANLIMSVLTAQNLIKSYKNYKVVKGVSLNIKSGEIVGLLGPNGAGKTTIFYMIVGLISLDAGNIILNNKDISLLSLSSRARCGIGYLPQESSIFRRLSVYDNIMAILQIRSTLTYSIRDKLIKKLMKEFHITHLRNNLGRSLSGGERRRVEIARALAADPKFILLDEPFANVDPISILEIKNIIRYLSKNGLGVLITDHNVRETLTVCQRAYIINQGCLIVHGTSNDIINNEYVKNIYLGKDFKL